MKPNETSVTRPPNQAIIEASRYTAELYPDQQSTAVQFFLSQPWTAMRNDQETFQRVHSTIDQWAALPQTPKTPLTDEQIKQIVDECWKAATRARLPKNPIVSERTRTVDSTDKGGHSKPETIIKPIKLRESIADEATNEVVLALLSPNPDATAKKHIQNGDIPRLCALFVDRLVKKQKELVFLDDPKADESDPPNSPMEQLLFARSAAYMYDNTPAYIQREMSADDAKVAYAKIREIVGQERAQRALAIANLHRNRKANENSFMSRLRKDLMPAYQYVLAYRYRE